MELHFRSLREVLCMTKQQAASVGERQPDREVNRVEGDEPELTASMLPQIAV